MSDEANVEVSEMPMDEAQAQPQEKMLTQSEVNALVGRTRMEAAERARKQAEAEFQQRMQEMESQKQQTPEQAPEIDAERIYQEVQERMNREMQERQFNEEMSRIANAYTTKMAEGGKKYEDFDKVMEGFNPADFPQLVVLVADLDNASDIMYELSKNPSKLATMHTLANVSPMKAQAELKAIGQSITANEQAKAEAEAQATNSPLDRLQPSRISGDSGTSSIRDLRSQSWLKG